MVYCNPSLQEQWALDAEREPLLSHRRRPSAGSTSSYSSTQGHNNHHHHQHRGVDVVQGVSNEVHQGHDGHSHGHSHAVFNHSSLRSVMLLLALSFHSVFEVANLQVQLFNQHFLLQGLAIGLQDSTSHMMTVFIAVITHKAVMAFSLGLNIAQSDLSVKAFIWSNVLFSLSSPVGVAIGRTSHLKQSLPPLALYHC